MKKTYFEKIEEIIKEREEKLGRKLTLDEQTQAKFEAMSELWIEAGEEIARKKSEENQ